MKLIELRKVLALSVAMAFVAGCSTTSTDTTNGGVDGVGAGTSIDAETSGLSAAELERRRLEQEQRAREGEDAALREVRVFYFDFDSNMVKPEAHLPLQAHAVYLQSNPNARVVLNGYGDERGTKEYNLALGERRAKAVERFLVVSGASANQIEVVSYGEEFPADPGHNEEAWSKNRRVELEYK